MGLVDGTCVGTGGSSYKPTASVTLYARWSDEYTVTYVANGGSVANAAVTVKMNQSITLQTPNERLEYKFEGWYTAATNGDKFGVSGDTYMPHSNITLYAQWSEISNHELMDNFENDSTYSNEYINNTKKKTLLVIGRALGNYDYAPAFIAGFLGHITPEGDIGYFEKYWGSSQQPYLLDWEYLGLSDYIKEYAGKYIMDKNFSTVQNVLSILEMMVGRRNLVLVAVSGQLSGLLF